MNHDVSHAFDVLKSAVQSDDEYAWGWHCNIAMAYQDEGATHEAGNKAAARFMKQCFDVNMNESPFYKYGKA